MNPQPAPNRWIGRSGLAGNARLRLFCFPFAGGGTAAYRHWINHFPCEIEICPVQLPGRECRLAEAPVRNLTTLVQSLAHGLTPWLDVPFAFFGHSLGAVVAFETARELRRTGAPTPEHLFVSAHGPAFIERNRKQLHRLPDSEFIQAVRGFGGIPDAVIRNRELLEIVLPVLRADFEMYETHCHMRAEPLDAPITALGGQSDVSVPEDYLDAWRSETAAAFKKQLFPGGHFYLQNAMPLVSARIMEELTNLMRSEMAAA